MCVYVCKIAGIIPTSKMTIGKEEDGIVCVPSVHTACDYTFSIKIMNCGTYGVYKLKKPDSCPQAYCFGEIHKLCLFRVIYRFKLMHVSYIT